MTETVWNFRFDEAELHFRYRLIDKSHSKIVVLFPGLRARTLTTIEYYNRLTWSDLITASCLYVADPGLRPNSPVRGSWFQGNAHVFSAEAVSRHVRTILKRFDVSERNCVLYGSSQGGFAAMAIGAFMPTATIVAECPQTDVARYNGVADVNLAAKACYGTETMAEVNEKFAYRIRLAELYKSRNYVPHSTILVKRSDNHHVDDHIRPLLDQVGRGRIAVELFDDLGAPGHTPLPKELIVDRLNAVPAS